MESLIGRSRRTDIVFHRTGLVELSSYVVRTLELVAGDVIDILADGGEYYLYVRGRAPQLLGVHEGRVYHSSRAGRHMRTWSRRLTEKIIMRCGGAGCVRLYTGEPLVRQCTVLLPIITQNLSNDEKAGSL